MAGFAYFPSTDEMFSAARGEGAFWDGERMKASGIQKKSEALLCCNGLGFMHRYPFAGELIQWLSEFWTVSEAWAAVSMQCSPRTRPRRRMD